MKNKISIGYRNIKIVNIVLLLSVFFLTIGFSSITISGKIENIMASIKPQAAARVTNVLLAESSSGGLTTSEDYNINSIFGNISLPNEDSTITFKVNVTVFNAAEMKLSSVTSINENLDYEFLNYTLGGALCNTNYECNYGATDEIYIKIKYKDGYFDASNTTFAFKMDFLFETIDLVAKIGNKYYETISEAVADVPENTKTTIVVLKNTSDNFEIASNKNVVLDLQNYIIKNKIASNIIKNSGTLEIKNGALSSDATYGVIDNLAGSKLYMSSGSIFATGKQAIYNDGGYVELSGTSSFSSTSNQRPTLHNLANGTMIIKGGSIESTVNTAIENHGNLTIGIKDGVVDNQSIIIQGSTYGVNSDVDFNFYDGIIKGSKSSVIDETKIIDHEVGYGLLHENEAINTKLYDTIRNEKIYVVTFDPNGGVVSEQTRIIEQNKKVGVLPTPTYDGYIFKGWYNQLEDGDRITMDYIVSSNQTIYAHWSSEDEYYVATIGEQTFKSLSEAIEAVPLDNTPTTIQILADTSDKVEIKANQNITLDLGENTLSNSIVSSPIIENFGTLNIINGTIASNATSGAINNKKNAKLYMSGGSIYATNTKQCIYNDGGYLEISGSAYLHSTTNQRAALQNLNGGRAVILGGTIISTAFHAVDNTANLTIGEKNGSIDSSTPTIIGKTYGVVNDNKVFNFYDGNINGETGSISGDITSTEDNSTRIDTSVLIDGTTYQSTYLQ